MVIGGEVAAHAVEEELPGASTEPPTVIGGEVQVVALIPALWRALQRSRRW